MPRLRIGTRRSALALWQAHRVRDLLVSAGADVEIIEIVTSGDRIQDRPLAQVGGKGLFVKELEEALLDGRCDLAVHSAKDVPSALPSGLMLAAFPMREDPRDALCAPRYRTIAALPPNARIGTSSLRRACALRAARPDLDVQSVRGNVETRLRKGEDATQLDGVVLALAGLKRLGLETHATEILSLDVSLPAAGQGALAIETAQSGAGRDFADRLDDPDTRAAVISERAVLRLLEGSCNVPLAAHAVHVDGALWLRACIGTPDGQRLLRAEARGAPPQAEMLGQDVGARLLAQGAKDILSVGH